MLGNWRSLSSIEKTNIISLCKKDFKIRLGRFAVWTLLFEQLPIALFLYSPFIIMNYESMRTSNSFLIINIINAALFFITMTIFFVVEFSKLKRAVHNVQTGKACCCEAFAHDVEGEKSFKLYGKYQFLYNIGCCPSETYIPRLKRIEQHTFQTAPNLSCDNNVIWVCFYPERPSSPIFQFSLYEAQKKLTEENLHTVSIDEKSKKRMIAYFRSNMIYSTAFVAILFIIGILSVNGRHSEEIVKYMLIFFFIILAFIVFHAIIRIVNVSNCMVVECTEVGRYTTTYHSRGVHYNYWSIYKIRNSNEIIGIKNPVYDDESIRMENKMENIQKQLDEMEKWLDETKTIIDEMKDDNYESSDNLKPFSNMIPEPPEPKIHYTKLIIYKTPFGIESEKILLD